MITEIITPTIEISRSIINEEKKIVKEKMKDYLLNKEEKKIFFKMKLKSKLDRSYLVAVRRYLRDIGINENTYTDDEVIYALILGKDKEKCLM